MEQPGDDTSKAMGQGYALLSVGITFGVTVTLFVLLGVWLDRKLGTTPLCIVAGAVAGVGLGGFWLYQRVIRQPGRNDSAH